MFKEANYEIISKNDAATRTEPNMYIQKDNIKYAVEVRSKITNNMISMLEEIKMKDPQYTVLFLIFDYIEESRKEKVKEKYQIEILDISNIIYIIQNNEQLTKELKEILDYSISGIEKVKPSIEISVPQAIIEESKSLGEELKSINPGKEQWGEYQNFCVKMLKNIFNDDLDSWEEQAKTDLNSNIFDLIARIKYRKKDEYEDFFHMIENMYSSKYIIFEFKNYTDKISDRDILQTSKYLHKAGLRRVAIILTRKGADESAKKMIRSVLRESGKVVLVLNDNDVNNMIKLFEEKDINASVVFQQKINDLLMHLEA